MADPAADFETEPRDRSNEERVHTDPMSQCVQNFVDALIDKADRADLDSNERILARYRHVYFSVRMRGSSADRNPSPTRLQATTTLRIAKPGHVEIHHARPRTSRPSADMRPHSGVGGWAPSPRKLSPEPIKMAFPTWSVLSTRTGA